MTPVLALGAVALLLLAGCVAGEPVVQEPQFRNVTFYGATKALQPTPIARLPLRVSAWGDEATVERLESRITAACERWQELLSWVPGMPADGPFVLTEPNQRDLWTTVEVYEDADVAGWGHAVPYWTADAPDWTPWVTGGRVQLQPEISQNDTCGVAILVHELGHVLGLTNSQNTGGVMDADGFCDERELTDATLELLADAWR